MKIRKPIILLSLTMLMLSAHSTYTFTYPHTNYKSCIKLCWFGGLPPWLRITFQCRGYRFDPWSRRILHPEGQVSPPDPRACALRQGKPPEREAHTQQLESSPGSPQLEEARVQQQRSSTAKKFKT